MRLVKVLAMLSLAVVGCSGSEQPRQTASQEPAATPQPRDPIAQIAQEFLEAVVAGDTNRATACLTPAAVAQFAASEQGFASPEIGAPDFKIGEVRRFEGGRAAVQCLLTDEAGDAEMLCLVKQCETGWKVSGVAYEADPAQPPVVLNFEQLAPPQPAAQPGYFVAEPPRQGVNPGAMGSQRTASEPAPGQLR